MPIIKSMHFFNLHFWTYLLIGRSCYHYFIDKVNITLCVYFEVPITSFFIIIIIIVIIIIIIFLSGAIFHVTFLNLRHNSFQTKEKTMADQNGGKFERFSKLKLHFI